GTAASAALTWTAGTAPTAAAVQTNLNTIPALAGNVSVTGPDGGPFRIEFTAALGNANVPQITVATGGGTTATPLTLYDGSGNAVQTLTVGGTSGGSFTPQFAGTSGTALTFTTGASPTAAQVLASLNAIP